MQLERDPTWTQDAHCYFPEWADRPDSTDPLFEADRNSYLAGGYSEEFGYTSVERLTAFPPLRGDPEHCGQWCVQIGCLHPGYPECPRPEDRGRRQTERSTGNGASSMAALGGRGSATGLPQRWREHARTAGVVRVQPGTAAGHNGVLGLILRAWVRLRIRRRAYGRLI